MASTVTPTTIQGALILETRVFEDDRGFFFESFNEREFGEAVGREIRFVQDNHSRSTKGVLRGLHYQLRQPQGKLVRVVTGAVWDVAVDIRRESETYGAWFGVELTAANKRQLWIPAGLAHGFLVVSESADVLYKTTDYYVADDQHCIIWNDPSLAIDWPDVDMPPILSARDRTGARFGEHD